MTSFPQRITLLFAATLLTALAQVPGFDFDRGSFSGTWKLNQQKSKWRGLRKPVSVIVSIEHKQSAFSYSGSVVDADGEIRHFEFNGSVDGKEYPTVREYGEGVVTLQWAGPNTLVATFKTNDGRWVETTTRSLSRDGKRLAQQSHLRAPDGEFTWTEFYDKQ
jgi:hypothetical protein